MRIVFTITAGQARDFGKALAAAVIGVDDDLPVELAVADAVTEPQDCGRLYVRSVAGDGLPDVAVDGSSLDGTDATGVAVRRDD